MGAIRDWLEDWGPIIAAPLAIIVLMVLFSIIAYIADQSDHRDVQAFCRSVDGEYGAGHCYKDGQEMKP